MKVGMFLCRAVHITATVMEGEPPLTSGDMPGIADECKRLVLRDTLTGESVTLDEYMMEFVYQKFINS